MEPTFFATPPELRAWFEEHHADRAELLVGFHRTGSGLPSITWAEAVDEALCFGWIDSVRMGLDESSYTIRFTPRKPRSVWSNRNVGRVQELSRLGLMHEAGLAAFEERAPERTGVYSFEQDAVALEPAFERKFRGNKKAWKFFGLSPPWYRRAATHWVMSAKKEETRRRRLASLIEHSAKGRTVPPLTRPTGKHGLQPADNDPSST